jgi:broad specificity phosphatase PhoE
MPITIAKKLHVRFWIRSDEGSSATDPRDERQTAALTIAMSVLTLVRHGQASFFSANYDELSGLGEQQMQLLGEYWARRGVSFDEIFTGPRVRQRHSAELAVAACRKAGQTCPEPVLLEELDEYDLKGLTRTLAPALAKLDTDFAQRVERHLRSDKEERIGNFQGMFEPLLLHWQSPAAAHIEMETWPAFRGRVHRAIRQLQERDVKGRRVAFFTSGGFIGSATQLAVAAPDRTALELHWRLRNGSLTEFAFTRDRFSLDTFNVVPHLEEAALWTYR